MIVQVKENQKKLLRSCEETAARGRAADAWVSRNKARNRKEKRVVRVFHTLRHFNASVRAQWGRSVEAAIEVTRIKKTFDTALKVWTKHTEVAYYVATAALTARVCGEAIRRHWWIENKNHRVRDVSLREDASRIRVNPDRMVVMRSFALNALRANGVKNVKRTLFENALSLEKLLTYEKLL
jgi:predicted transposase YbfD/YdcC